MGGNKKQRTKGNLKPSSSRRTAELLTASGVTGFIGFSGLSTDLPGYVPPSGQQLSDDVESTVDGDFRMVMRKMTKRDMVTKVKALHEFSQLCQEKDDNAVKGALPFWPRLYIKLGLENDRRVREATHLANEQLALKVKKGIAPYLKSIMGVWLVSLCDPYAPAASAARNAFNSAIPVAKQPDALDFCKEEIFHYLQDILFVQTANTLSDDKSSAAAEMEEKYTRQVAGCLKALKLFLATVEINDSNGERIQELLNKILEEPKYWKYAKHKDPQIRSAWYAAMSTVCQSFGESACQHAHKLCPLTLGRLADGDPVVAPLIWDTSLCILVNIKDCWEHVNISKAFLPQLWNFLKDGGKGNASNVFPSLLPLISKIPLSVIGDGSIFYKDFFTNLRQGLFLDKVQASASETNAIVSAFVECLKYVLVRHNSCSDSDVSLTEGLVVDHFLSVLKTCITNSHHLYPTLGALLLDLESQLRNEETSKTISGALTSFWTQFVAFCETILAGTSVAAQSTMLANLASFFNGLHTPVVKRSQMKVKFEVQTSAEEVTVTESVYRQREWTSDSPLVGSTQKLCFAVLSELKSNPSSEYMNLLLEMCRAVQSKRLFSELVKRFESEKEFSDDEAPMLFFQVVLLPLILDNRMKRDFVRDGVNLTFVLCSCTTQDCTFAILRELCKSKDAAILEEVICKAAHSKNGPFWEWLKSDEVGEIVLELAKQLADLTSTEPKDSTSTNSSWKILNLCLASSEHFEPVIRTEYLRKLLDIFHASVQNLFPVCKRQPSDINRILEFVCDLALNLFDSCMDCWCIPAVEKLLLTLFCLSSESSDLPLLANEKVEQTWLSGTKKLVSLRGGLLNEGGFLYLASRKIHDLILSGLHLEDRSETVEELTLKFLTSVYEALPDSKDSEQSLLTSPTICALLQVILPSLEEWQKLESASDSMDTFLHLLRGEFILAPFEYTGTYKKIAICGATLHRVARITVKLLESMLVGSDTLKTEDSTTFDLLSSHLLFLTLSAAYVKNSQQENSKNLINSMINLFSFFKWEDAQNFLNLLASRAKEKGFLWSLTLAQTTSWLIDRFPQVSNWCKNFVRQQDLVGEIAQFHTLQCLSKHLDNKSSTELTSKAICHLVSIEDLLTPNGAGYLGLLSTCQITDEITAALDFLEGTRKVKPELFLSDCCISNEQNQMMAFSTSTATFFAAVMDKKTDVLLRSHWDMMLCCLTGWIQSCLKSKEILGGSAVATNFACQTLHLLSSASRFFGSSEAAELFQGELVTEWKELYTEDIHSALLPLFLWMAGETSSNTSPPVRELLKLLALNLEGITIEDVVKHGSNQAAAERSCEDYNAIATRFYPLLTHPLYPVQLTGHNICYSVIERIPQMPLPDCSQAEDKDEKMRPPPPFVAKMLDSTNQVVETMLSDLQVGDCCVVQPDTDAFTYTQAYLFSWLHMLKLFSAASSEVRSAYAVYLQQQNYLQNLLVNLFRLMPQNPLISEKAVATPTRGGTIKNMFTEPLQLDVRAPSSSLWLQHLACQVYLETLRKLPAMVRQWWTNQDNRTTDIVNKYTIDYVSSYICTQEIKCVQITDKKFENMTVRARPTAREVVARYSVDEITIELVIRLPPNHPLGPVQVETCQRVGVGQTQWRNWLLQLTTFLTYQNGSILDGLSLWKCNVDKRFEGVEECMICFYVLHGSTCQLPRLTCKTCKKKYHSACLYKWFSTSNNSACPLCRNLF